MNLSDDFTDSVTAEDGISTRLVTPQDLAQVLQVSTRTLYRWIDQGRLVRPMRIGGVMRWRWGDVARWLEDQAP